jgi:hypothetical protein
MEGGTMLIGLVRFVSLGFPLVVSSELFRYHHLAFQALFSFKPANSWRGQIHSKSLVSHNSL